MRSTKLIITLFVAIVAASVTANAANILCLIGVASHSHQLWSNVLFKALAAKGHTLTVVTPDVNEEPIENISFIHLERTYEVVNKHYQDYNMKTFTPPNAFMQALVWYERQMPTCKGILASEGFKAAVAMGGQQRHTFDLIIYDTTNGPWCLLSLAHLFGEVPIVGISAFKVIPDVFEMARGGYANPAAVPFFSTEFGVNMSAWQRLYNSALYSLAHFYKHYVVYPVIQGMMSQNTHVQNAKLPLTVDDLKQRIKVILVNTHPAIDYAQSLPPNVIEVGGLQITEPQPLPADIIQFIDSSQRGFILISLGSHYRIEMLGEERVKAIISAITRFPGYIFLWKVERTEFIKNAPKNLYMSEWFPQNDVLAHPKIKAFLTHAGGLSIQEAAYYGVPVVTLPFLMDQVNNAQRATERGFGIRLNLNNLSEDSIYNAMSTILSKESYSSSAKRVQSAFRAREKQPLKTAVWWVEQLLVHPKGFDHLVLESSADFNYFVAHSLDVILLISIFFVALFINSWFVIKRSIDGFRKSKKSKDAKIVSKDKSSKKLKAKKN